MLYHENMIRMIADDRLRSISRTRHGSAWAKGRRWKRRHPEDRRASSRLRPASTG